MGKRHIISDKRTLEQEVADSVLESKGAAITIGGTEYRPAPPTIATIIEISAIVSTIPTVNKDSDNILYEVLRTAKDMRPLGDIAAVLILGSKRARENRPITKAGEKTEARYWSWRKFRMVTETKQGEDTTVSERRYLSDAILSEMSPHTLLELVIKLIGNLQLGDFFELTTSLSAANLLKRTKEVGTASGE